MIQVCTPAEMTCFRPDVKSISRVCSKTMVN